MEKKPNMLAQIKTLTQTQIDLWKAKIKSQINTLEETVYEAKALETEPMDMTDSQGYYEKNRNITNELLKSMAKADSIVSLVIRTYINKAASYARRVEKPHEKGFKIVLKNREQALEKIKEELFGKEPEFGQERKLNAKQINAADADKNQQVSDVEMQRIAERELKKKTRARIEEIEEFILNCGIKEDKPFKYKKWNLDTFFRGALRDSLVYDLMGVEKVRDAQGNLSYFYPVDSSTIFYASPKLKYFKTLEKKDIFDGKVIAQLDEAKLAADKYKYVQVVKGIIRRAFLETEMSVGVRNPNTDIYSNGYGISELELLIDIVSSHMFAEYYNKSYFTQGFSAKGILHIKAPLNRRKLEQLRIQWKHMISGGANSFQTPIVSGSDDVKWIPLTQNHNDIEFSNYINYLIKIICGLYQIDPMEIGFSMRSEGGRSGGMSNDDAGQKVDLSREKGLVPLLKFLAMFINDNIISDLDPNYKLEFVGITDESSKEMLERLTKEKSIRPINSILEELGESPIPGCDQLILDPVYFQYFSQFSPEAKKNQEQQQMQGMFQQGMDQFDQGEEDFGKSLKKSLPLSIEYYKIEDDNE